MNNESQNIIDIIDSLNISESKKQSIRDRLKNEHFSDELFDEVDSLINEEIMIVDKEINKTEDEEQKTNEDLAKTKEENKKKKQELLKKHRSDLKKIYDESLIEGKKIAGEVDQDKENIQHQEELNDVDNIRKKLNI